MEGMVFTMSFQKQLSENKNPSIAKIAEYLMKREDLKEKLENPKKSLKKMFEYVRSEAKKQAVNNCACLSDEEVYGLAVHYYDEESLDVKPVKAITKTTEKPAEVTPVQKPKLAPKKKKKEEVVEGQMSLIFDD